MTLLLSFLLLTTPTPSFDYEPHYCEEVATITAEMIKEKVLTYKEAVAIVDRCLKTSAPYQAL